MGLPADRVSTAGTPPGDGSGAVNRYESLDRVGDLVWRRGPQALGRRSFSLGVALADGSWLRAWPAAGATAPVFALIVGAVLARVRPDPTYTSSVAVLVLLVALAGIGAGIGVWTWLGYVGADLVVNRGGSALGLYGPSDTLSKAWDIYVPRVLTYVLLAVLLVIMPVAATGIRVQLSRLSRMSGDLKTGLDALFQGVLFGIGVALWTQATAFMARPLWSFSGRIPDIQAIAPLQEHAVLLGIVGGAVAGTRVVIAAQARVRLPAMQGALFAPGTTGWPWWISATARAALLTVLLAGLIASVSQGLLVFVVLLAACMLRAVALPLLTSYTALVARVPLLVRLAVVAGVGWVAANVLVQPAVERGESSFRWMLAAAVASTLVGAALLPPIRLRPRSGEGAQAR